MHQVLTDLFSDYQAERLQGGDVNQVFRITKNEDEFVVKINSWADFPGMFQKEVDGLKSFSDIFRTPEIIKVSQHEQWQFLQMEFLPKTTIIDGFWSEFGQKLAKMHQMSSKSFGLDQSNFIGSLIQQNDFHDKWETFLIEQRLAPMIEMAVNSGEVNFVESKIIENYYKRINELYPSEPPALLHGDLWSGNFIASQKGPILIDPAVYFGHREMDLGMMHLFGGFELDLFDVYNDFYPLEKNWKSRIRINQLYPLLVHLNLFGRSYWNQVYDILKPFS